MAPLVKIYAAIESYNETKHQIGFVFSDSLFAVRSTQYELNWVCFFRLATEDSEDSERFSLFRISDLGFRISGRRPANWLCFAKLATDTYTGGTSGTSFTD